MPIDATIKSIIHTVVIIAVCIWLLLLLVNAFGGGAPFSLGPAHR